MKKLAINTGAPRNVVGHVISGAVASGIVAGSLNYARYKKGEQNKKEAVSNTAKMTLIGAISTSCAVAATNCLGQGQIFKMLGIISAGAAGLYAIEKADEKNTNQKSDLIQNLGESNEI